MGSLRESYFRSGYVTWLRMCRLKPVEEMTVQGNYVASGSILGRVAVYDNTYVAVGDDESVFFLPDVLDKVG